MIFSLFKGLIFINFSYASSGTSLVSDYYGCPNSSYLCEALNENLKRDSSRCRLSPRHVASLNSYMAQQGDKDKYKEVNGRIRYFGPFTGKYGYEMVKEGRRFKVRANIFFQNLHQYSLGDIRSYELKIKQAEDIWNQNNPFKKDYSFEFNLVKNKSQSVIAPNLIRRNTRGPYFAQWSLQWSKDTIAHEFGHILGLFDEYSYNDSSKPNCDSSSIMCSSHRGDPLHYHYHLLLQRAFCLVGK